MIYLSFIISVIGQGAEMMLLSWLNFENIVLEQACTSIPYTSQFPDKKDKIYIFLILKLLARNKPVLLILTPHCPQTRKIKYIFLNFETIG